MYPGSPGKAARFALPEPAAADFVVSRRLRAGFAVVGAAAGVFQGRANTLITLCTPDDSMRTAVVGTLSFYWAYFCDILWLFEGASINDRNETFPICTTRTQSAVADFRCPWDTTLHRFLMRVCMMSAQAERSFLSIRVAQPRSCLFFLRWGTLPPFSGKRKPTCETPKNVT